MKLSVGVLPWLSMVRFQDIGKSFFCLLLFLSLFLGSLGFVLGGTLVHGWFFVSFIFLGLVFYLFIGRSEWERIPIFFLILFIWGSLALIFMEDGKIGSAFFSQFLNEWMSSLLMGSALFSMILGHWYLIRPRLSFHYLIRACLIFLTLTIFRMMEVVGMLFLRKTGSWMDLLNGAGDIFFLTRFLWGGVLPIFFLVFAYRCSKIHSNRSTTGILYFTTASIFMGELMAGYLSEVSGLLF
ncbi:MAG: hypothetical protein HYS07_09650 [Chlamydiae bacterium]|nr:hypothetical protein [Chlamydiota bacterium]MBI3277102.1 hypothetical protein [Chlamydiota bacterium]